MTTDPTNPESSLLNWYGGLRDGGSQATEKLWRLYFQRMVQLARRKLDGSKRTTRDEEDIALSAFKSFCEGFRQGRFSGSKGDTNLWPLLVTMTVNKAIDHMRSEKRAKRGGKNRVFSQSDGPDCDRVWNELVSAEPPPELEVAANESFELLLDSLDRTGDRSLRVIAIGSMEGNSVAELAVELHCTPRTIQRKLKTIRAVWESENP